jgi:hypothetical protein
MAYADKTIRFVVNPAVVNPAWYQAANDQQWSALTAGPAPQLSNVDPCPAGNCSYTGSTGFESVCSAYVGAAASSESLIIAFQGGHHDYAGNGVYEYMFSEDVPRWYRRVDPSTSVQEDVGYYSDGRPAARHGYKSDCFIPTLSGSSNGNRYFAAFGGSTWGSGNTTTSLAASWQRGTSAPDPQSFWPNSTPGTHNYDAYVCWDPVTERVWKRDGSYPTYTYALRSMDPRTKAWTTHGSTVAGSFPNGAYLSSMVDPIRRVMVMCYRAQIVVTDLEHPNEAGRVYAVSGLPASGNGGFAYEQLSGKWVQWSGGSTLRTITPPANYRSGDGSTSNSLNASASYSAVTVTPSAGATPTSEQGGGTHGRFSYIENPRGFCVVNATNQPVYFFKCATSL